MPRYFIELAYNGSQFCGFQKQADQISIQGEVEKALSTILRSPIDTTTSSRTDSGVHALQNYLHFDTEVAMSPTLVYNANAILHHDILIHSLKPVKAKAHARFDALTRTYEYIVYQKKNPFFRNEGYFFPFALDKKLLMQSAKILLENTNFQSFCKRHVEVNNYNCELDIVQWEEIKNGIHSNFDYLKFTVRGNRFLRGMVRALVGTSLQIARKKIPLSDLEKIIQSNDCQQADFSAEAKGLKLVNVEFPKEIFL